MMLGTRDTFTYFQCGQCNTVQISRLLGSLNRYYPGSYLSFTPRDRLVQRLKGYRLGWDLFRTPRIGFVLRRLFGASPYAYFLKDIRSSRRQPVLDVGCGNADLLSQMAWAGFTNLTGCDPFLPEDQKSPDDRLTLIRAPIDGVRGRYAAIMFNHSLEHLTDPLATLRHAADRLVKDGLLLIRMPVPAEAWRIYGADWVQLDAPRHLHLLTPDTCIRLVEPLGLRWIKTEFDSSEFQFWGSEQYKRDIPMMSETSFAQDPKSSLFSIDDIRLFKEEAARLNARQEGDSAYLLFQKRT